MYSAQNGLNNGNYHGSFVVAEKAVIWNVTKPYSQGFLNTLIFKISRKLHHYGLVSAIPIMKFLVTQKEHSLALTWKVVSSFLPVTTKASMNRDHPRNRTSD